MNKHPRTLDDVRAVVYVRQSTKRDDGSEASPEAQTTKCGALIQAKGWHLAGHFADVGRSGWDPNVERPEFEEMLTAVRSGEVDAVVVFALSRLTRQGAFEAMKINEELQDHGVLLVSVEEPFLDTSTPVGVAIFGLIAALAKQESDLKSAYISATKEGIRKVGGHVSGMAPYGFASERVQRGKLNVARLVPDPVEAPHVRNMVAWATEGLSASSIARRLNQEGAPTKNSRDVARVEARRKRAVSAPHVTTAWTSSTVIRVLRDPRLAGYAMVWEGRVEKTKDSPGKAGKRVILRDETGAPMASHEGVVSPEDWWRLQEVMDGRRPVVAQTRRSRPSLLGGMSRLFCGVCRSVMVTDERNGKRLYRCNRAGAGLVPGHGGLAIAMDVTDDVVTRAVWSRLSALDPADPEDLEFLAEASRRFAAQVDTTGRDAELAAARAELEHVRGALRTLFQDRQDGIYEGSTGREMFLEGKTRLEAHESRTAERVASLAGAGETALAIPTEWTEPGEDPIGEGSPWAEWDLAERREFLALFLDRVDVDKSTGRGRHANTAERVRISWATAPAA